jgi:molybdopterin/thiamine biosynthesis adenylyltransferase
VSDEVTQQVEAGTSASASTAEAELKARGFGRADDGVWSGTLDCGEHGAVLATVQLPEDFPGVIPEIFVERSALARRVPHVEKSGKVCIAPTTGVLIDTANPRGVMREAFERAQHVLVKGLSGANDDDFTNEFLAYWEPGSEGTVWTTCNPSGQSRPIKQVSISRSAQDKGEVLLLADSSNDALEWASKLGRQVERRGEAFFVELQSAFIPPDFEEKLSTAEVIEIIRSHATSQTERDLRAWLAGQHLPCTIMMSMPLNGKYAGRVVIVVRLKKAVGESARRAHKGFRVGHVPANWEIRFTHDTPVTKFRIERFDPDYLFTRGGASGDMYPKTVAIIGCGSVGSHVTEQLASLGVGRLRLVEPKVLTAANVHRHALGVNYVGINKALGMKVELGLRFPHIRVECREERVEKVLQKDPDFIMGVDLAIIALGDENLELRLNDMLGHSVPRLHVWVEPLGIGIHVLATGFAPGLGCYRCLFDVDPLHGLYNRSAFAAPGQSFQRTFSGCAGTFTPFASIDANQAALEATRLAIDFLLNEETRNLLVSLRGSVVSFSRAGFLLSARGTAFRAGELRQEERFVRSDCISCAKVIA